MDWSFTRQEQVLRWILPGLGLFGVTHYVFIGPKWGWDVLEVMLASLMTFLLTYGVYHNINVERKRKQLSARGWRQCLHCKFDLRGLPDSGACPECGRAYDIDSLREAWKKELM